MSEHAVEPLVALRRLAADAPWSVGELAALADRLLGCQGEGPPRPTTERTVRFYVTRGVVRPPFGRGPGSTWGYPHLTELLAARLAQRDGETLDAVVRRRQVLDDPALERYTAERLGAVPIDAEQGNGDPAPVAPLASQWRRYPVGTGVELHLAADHPLVGDPGRLGALLDGLAREATPSAPES